MAGAPKANNQPTPCSYLARIKPSPCTFIGDWRVIGDRRRNDHKEVVHISPADGLVKEESEVPAARAHSGNAAPAAVTNHYLLVGYTGSLWLME